MRSKVSMWLYSAAIAKSNDGIILEINFYLQSFTELKKYEQDWNKAFEDIYVDTDIFFSYFFRACNSVIPIIFYLFFSVHVVLCFPGANTL